MEREHSTQGTRKGCQEKGMLPGIKLILRRPINFAHSAHLKINLHLVQQAKRVKLLTANAIKTMKILNR